MASYFSIKLFCNCIINIFCINGSKSIQNMHDSHSVFICRSIMTAFIPLGSLKTSYSRYSALLDIGYLHGFPNLTNTRVGSYPRRACISNTFCKQILDSQKSIPSTKKQYRLWWVNNKIKRLIRQRYKTFCTMEQFHTRGNTYQFKKNRRMGLLSRENYNKITTNT